MAESIAGTSQPKTLSDRMGFGKYKDKTVRWVIDNDADYMRWALATIDWLKLDKAANDYYEDQIDFDDFADDAWHPKSPSDWSED